MKIDYDFKVGDTVTDTLGNYTSIVRHIENDCILLSRVERPDLVYSQAPRYVKKH